MSSSPAVPQGWRHPRRGCEQRSGRFHDARSSSGSQISSQPHSYRHSVLTEQDRNNIRWLQQQRVRIRVKFVGITYCVPEPGALIVQQTSLLALIESRRVIW